jgi:hypothetical protein
VDVISLFMALLSSRGISTPSLQARGEQRRFFYFNNDRDIPGRLEVVAIASTMRQVPTMTLRMPRAVRWCRLSRIGGHPWLRRRIC